MRQWLVRVFTFSIQAGEWLTRLEQQVEGLKLEAMTEQCTPEGMWITVCVSFTSDVTAWQEDLS